MNNAFKEKCGSAFSLDFSSSWLLICCFILLNVIRLWAHCLALYIITLSACALLYFVRIWIYLQDKLLYLFLVLLCQFLNIDLLVFIFRNIRVLLIWGYYILLDHLQIQAILQFLSDQFPGLQKNLTVKLWKNSSHITMHQHICRTKWFISPVKFKNWRWAS